MLPKEHRLSTTYEFNKTRRLGSKKRTSLFDIFYLDVKGYEGPSRVGIVVTTKYSKVAPVRNRVKRVFREAVRDNLEKISPGYWIVLHPSKLAEKKKYEEVNTEFIKALSEVPFTN
ncbi:ribonuclease P protein component [candidate division WWE3 bacterium]|jgi:ribonuclease P protein component|nr:ribonuclease P protein component [candidate division WWE3 bacterium]MBT7350288.1 ribonuclease P protein component [candidate division WWE3 bacterium]